MTNISINEYYAKHQAEQRRRLQALRPAMFAALKAARIRFVNVHYDGEGDSGQINEFLALDQDDKGVDLRAPHPIIVPDDHQPKTSLADLVEDFCWIALSLYHDGFENNDGGYGTMTIDVTEGRITLDHNDRFIDVNRTVSEV